MAETKDPTWYRPVCDILLAKMQRWFDMYERGDEAASRKFVTMNGRIVNKVTMYAHRMWSARPFLYQFE